MAQKLKTYKEDQLPGGKHWDPSPSIREALKDLEPTNDACESILVLNDWLQKTTPNITQRTVSAMVQMKKNKTMGWLELQDQARKDRIIDLAQSRAKKVEEGSKVENEEHRLY